MGNLTAGNYETEEAFRRAIHEVRSYTDRPFMVNVTLHPSVRLTRRHHEMYIRVCGEERVAGVEFSGTPVDRAFGTETVGFLKKAGVRLFQKVGSVRHAVHAEKAGYDGVYAAGVEEGGHPLMDDVTTVVLVPRIAESVKIPVVAAGGMADGRSLAAALVLGAEAVMMATRFIATVECEVHEDIKRHLVERQEYDTVLFGRSLGMQGRALRNRMIREISAVEERGGGFDEMAPLLSGLRIRKAWETGDMDNAPLMVGQSVGLVRDIPTCRDLLEGIASEAARRAEAAGKMLGAKRNGGP
jgi:nitronate monooxygenase